MKFVLKIKANTAKSTEIFLPLHLKPTNMRTCNAESQKRSAKGSNFKEVDNALPIKKLSFKECNTLCIMLSKYCTLYSISNKDIYSQKLGRCLSFYIALLQITLNM